MWGHDSPDLPNLWPCQCSVNLLQLMKLSLLFNIINSSKKVWKLKFDWSYLSYYHIFFIVIGIIKKLVQLPFHWYHICNVYEIMESTLRLVLAESQKWNLAKHCVYYILTIVQSRWRMNTKADSLLGNAKELQDFISDPHSYPVVLYIPWFYNHYKWGIILKRIKQAL